MSAQLPSIFTLADEITRFPFGASAAGRRAETLVKTDRLRVVLVTMRAGAALHDHTAPGPITIQTLSGHFMVSTDDVNHDLASGMLIAIAANVVHAVHAVSEGAFLLTISWPPRAAEEDQREHHAQYLHSPARSEVEDKRSPQPPSGSSNPIEPGLGRGND